MITAYLLSAMWSAFMAGIGFHAVATDHDKKAVTTYHIGINYAGQETSRCKEETHE